MPKTRPPFPPEFRREAVAVVRSGRPVPEVAEALGVSQQSIWNWVKRRPVLHADVSVARRGQRTI